MYVAEYGRENSEVIILLHGGGLSWWNYRDAAELLKERFHVVLPVLDGHAESGTAFTTIQDNADRLIAYIDETLSGHVLLIAGVSLGGQVLLEILARRSSICDYAVIESALVCPMKLTAALIRPSFALCYPLISKRWFARLQFHSLKINPALFDLYYRDTTRIAKDDLIAFMIANSLYRVSDALARSSAKALVLVGGKERPIMKKSAESIAAHIPASSMEVLRGLHHGEFSMNYAERYVKRLLRFMSM